MKLKKGEWVMYVAHYDKSPSIEEEDKLFFTIGKIYQIHTANKEKNGKYYPMLKVGDYKRHVSQDQIEKILDCKLNRILYPEAFKGGENG